MTDSITALNQLSARETQITAMILGGARGKDIAAALGISSKSTSTYRMRAYKKLGVKNSAELFFLITKTQLIDCNFNSEVFMSNKFTIEIARLAARRAKLCQDFDAGVKKSIELEQRVAEIDAMLRNLANEEREIEAALKKLDPNYKE